MPALIIIVVLIAGFFVMRQFIVPASSPLPDNLGVTGGELTKCPDAPNCVSTQDDAGNSHYVAPLDFKSDKSTTHAALTMIINDMGGQIITNTDDYIHARFRSPMMNFIDDVELYLDSSANSVQMRSAARLGYGDMGVNKKRIESIRQAYNGA
ncbi:MAG: DUF1499 domain-containing protein [Aggregatilineales bacterium]